MNKDHEGRMQDEMNRNQGQGARATGRARGNPPSPLTGIGLRNRTRSFPALFLPRASALYSRHRGAVYVYVLATSLLVSIVGLSVLTVAQINARASRQGNESIQAELLAESAVEYALSALAADANWRTTYTSGSLTTGKTLGHGSISFKLVDENDGSLGNNTTDPVRVYGFGQVNSTVKVYSAQLVPTTVPLTCLQVANDSVGTLSLATFSCGGTGTLATNTQITGSGTLTSGIALESAGTIDFTG